MYYLTNTVHIFCVYCEYMYILTNSSTNPRACVNTNCTAVKGIKKQHLVEIRSLANPPGPVKMALEAICTLLGEQNLDWKALRSLIMKDAFIPNIVSFDTEAIS